MFDLLKKFNKLRYLMGLLIIVFLTSFLAFFLGFEQMFLTNSPSFKPQVTAQENISLVNDDTVIVKEKEYLCGEKELLEEAKASQDLIGKNYLELLEIYPQEAGWSIKEAQDNKLIFTLKIDEFCLYHKDYYHLGIFENKLAVYQGPLGNNTKLLRVENIEISVLDQSWQERLNQAMEFTDQFPEIQYQLLYDPENKVEFRSEAELNLILQNFDEYIGT